MYFQDLTKDKVHKNVELSLTGHKAHQGVKFCLVSKNE
jgi:hypothetical protein